MYSFNLYSYTHNRENYVTIIIKFCNKKSQAGLFRTVPGKNYVASREVSATLLSQGVWFIFLLSCISQFKKRWFQIAFHYVLSKTVEHGYLAANQAAEVVLVYLYTPNTTYMYNLYMYEHRLYFHDFVLRTDAPVGVPRAPDVSSVDSHGGGAAARVHTQPGGEGEPRPPRHQPTADPRRQARHTRLHPLVHCSYLWSVNISVPLPYYPYSQFVQCGRREKREGRTQETGRRTEG